jgi:hypothetical protein
MALSYHCRAMLCCAFVSTRCVPRVCLRSPNVVTKCGCMETSACLSPVSCRPTPWGDSGRYLLVTTKRCLQRQMLYWQDQHTCYTCSQAAGLATNRAFCFASLVLTSARLQTSSAEAFKQLTTGANSFHGDVQCSADAAACLGCERPCSSRHSSERTPHRARARARARHCLSACAPESSLTSC